MVCADGFVVCRVQASLDLADQKFYRWNYRNVNSTVVVKGDYVKNQFPGKFIVLDGPDGRGRQGKPVTGAEQLQGSGRFVVTNVY